MPESTKKPSLLNKEKDKKNEKEEEEESKEDQGPGYITYDNDFMTLKEALGGYNGEKTKDLAEKAAAENKRVLWYNFHPHNSDDPVLRTIMDTKWWNDNDAKKGGSIKQSKY